MVRGGGGQTAVEVFGEGGGGGVIEDQGGRKCQAGRRFQPVAQFDGRQRVEAQVLERAAGVDVSGAGASQHGGGVATDHVDEFAVSLLGIERTQSGDQSRRRDGGVGVVDDASGPAGGQLAEQRRWRGGVGAERAGVEPGGDHDGAVRDHRGIEQLQRLRG
ncbi:hypothetical protein LAUMK13_02466 [Mycobacterium innocens]|uniref:Uncharacterized protein n=1 Tax=Mycobacterium innocens TaxID=2341083 RepID=A0A498PZB5_9MYCO|nr:hypothetical protein LAUMK13_02466 [Mycobacterium innocens]